MTRNWLFAALAVLALAVPSSAYAAGNADAGMAKAKSCAGCHGADGKGKNGNPAIAGMSESAFADALTAYKSGAKKNKMMNALAKRLSDEDIANLAAYYATLK